MGYGEAGVRSSLEQVRRRSAPGGGPALCLLRAGGTSRSCRCLCGPLADGSGKVRPPTHPSTSPSLRVYREEATVCPSNDSSDLSVGLKF